MSGSYQSAVERMYALGHELAHTPSHKFDLEHMRGLLDALEHPEGKFPSVLIAGTNGKGSTAATLASILQAAGLCTGLYTSPHLVRINERIRINGEQMPDDQFGLLHGVVDRTAERLVEDGELPWHPSFFEMLTAIAFEYFANQKVDIAVLEVGMGGRLDATNVVEPLLSVITDISLDHQKFLGNTITEIAQEKAGILRKNGVLVTLPQTPEANDTIGRAALEMGTAVLSAVPFVPPISPASPPLWEPVPRSQSQRRRVVSRYPLSVLGKEIIVETPLAGRHQLRNVALAIASAEHLTAQFPSITADCIASGIRETRWPGRFQVVTGGEDVPEFVLDVAHNPAGAWALRSTLSSLYQSRQLVFVFGAMRDKAIREMAEILFPLAERVIATRADNPRSATPQEISEAAGRTGAEIDFASDVPSAISKARLLAAGEKVVVVTGSIYIVGEAMQVLGVSA
ncbi:MAG TPA: folylpolyglutamate synthase/dihydrofolate synthase family protein [Terriglobales bacterium]|jgi:dihydrofolate synthase/folylpolyglutamate synthase|nr:folylpolyglutamate synthase/dihydrofolate synthase family protein [Terriglobales bacterium]